MSSSINQVLKILNVTLPIFIAFILVMLNVRFAVNSLPLQEALFERNNISAVSNLSPSDLRDISKQIQAYFNDDSEPLVVTLAGNNKTLNLFTKDEASHMADVKKLFHFLFTAQNYLVSIIFICAVLSYLFLKKSAYVAIARWIKYGGVVTIFLILFIGVISVVAFEPLFTLFHYIGFPQGNWTFNPRTSALVQIFPLGFWRDMTFVIASLSIFEALLCVSFGQFVPRIWKPKS